MLYLCDMKELTVIIRPLTSRPITVKTLRAIAEQALEARAISAEVRRYHYRCIETFFWFMKVDGFTRNVFRRYKRFIGEKDLAVNCFPSAKVGHIGTEG